MIIQACLNGRRTKEYHPAVPISHREIAADAKRCLEAGAAEIHVHATNEDGQESLASVATLVEALRIICPGTSIGVSTGAWIENDIIKTRSIIASWSRRPDYASVNLSEEDAPEIIKILGQIDVGIEAGISTVADAERLASMSNLRGLRRALIEIEDQDIPKGSAMVDEIRSILRESFADLPILLHGVDGTVWHYVEAARENYLSTRIGFEDCKLLPNGQVAKDNASLISSASKIFL